MDPIADMFSQIKNAQNVQKEKLLISYSKIKIAILAILKSRNQIIDYRILENKFNKDSGKNNKTKAIFGKIEIHLIKNNQIDIRRISRPGRRVYKSYNDIPRPPRSRSMMIVSTSKGVFEGEEARKKGLGGELLAEIR